MLQCTLLNKLSSFKSIALILFVGLVLAGCKAFQNQSNAFENPVCAPPCWESITPGTTTKEDASEILSKISEDQVTVKLNNPSAETDSEIRFSSKNIDGSVVFIGDTVSLIPLTQKFNVSLQSAIEIFGEPESVLVYRGGEYIGVTFYKPQTGIAFSYTSSAQKRSPSWAQPPDWIYSEIKPEAQVNFVTFFIPNQEKPLLDYRVLS